MILSCSLSTVYITIVYIYTLRGGNRQIHYCREAFVLQRERDIGACGQSHIGGV